MEYIQNIKEWFSQNTFIVSAIKFLLWFIVVLISIQVLRKFLKKRLPDSSARYKSQKGVEVIGYIVLIILSVSYFTGNIKDFTLAVGLFSAGIAFTLQELILSIAGSIYIFIVKVYAPGDRIEINGIKGDVIDIDSIYTTMMEIGEWVNSDNYSGRIVKLSNAFVFKGPVYNYSKDFPFIWDEFDIPVHYSSNVELAKKIIIDVASDVLTPYVKESKQSWSKVVSKYYIENAEVDPTIAITLTENWITFNLRYIVNYRKRRSTKHILHEKISSKIKSTNGEVVLASSTIEIVKIPSRDIQSSSFNNPKL